MSEYLRQLVADHLIHAWDLAAATGGDRRLDHDLVAERGRVVRRTRAAVSRRPGIIGARVETA